MLRVFGFGLITRRLVMSWSRFNVFFEKMHSGVLEWFRFVRACFFCKTCSFLSNCLFLCYLIEKKFISFVFYDVKPIAFVKLIYDFFLENRILNSCRLHRFLNVLFIKSNSCFPDR